MKKFTCFALSVLLSLSFCIPAAAAEDYGVIYDETEQLGSESLQHAGGHAACAYRAVWC